MFPTVSLPLLGRKRITRWIETRFAEPALQAGRAGRAGVAPGSESRLGTTLPLATHGQSRRRDQLPGDTDVPAEFDALLSAQRG